MRAPRHPPGPAPSGPGDHALAWCALAALAAMTWVSFGVATGILLGALMAFVLDPLYRRLARRLGRPWMAQLACTLIVVCAIAALVLGVSTILVARGRVLTANLITSLGAGGALRTKLEVLSRRLGPLGLDLTQLIDRAKEEASSIATYGAGLAATIAIRTARMLLACFFLVLSCHFVLAYGVAIEHSIEDLAPLSPAHTHALLRELRRAGRATLLGTVVTGIAQGAIAAAIFGVVGLPEPLFFGALTAVASLLPAVGTLLVFVPCGAWLIATGHVAAGVATLVACQLLVVFFCDYFLRPRLVGRARLPMLLASVALFGGVEAFGLVGLVTGPLIMALAVATLDLYRRTRIGGPAPGTETRRPRSQEPLPAVRS